MDQNKKDSKFQSKAKSDPAVIVAMIGAIATIIVTVLGLVTTYMESKLNPTTTPTILFQPTPTHTSTVSSVGTPTPPAIDTTAEPALREIYKYLESINLRLASLENQSQDSKISSAEITRLNTRLQTIEDVILENPEKVLQVVLLQKEIDAFRSETQRTNNIYTWILGSIFTSTISILAITTNLLKTKNENKQVDISELKQKAHQSDEQIKKLAEQISLEQKEKKDLLEKVNELRDQIEKSKGRKR